MYFFEVHNNIALDVMDKTTRQYTEFNVNKLD